jgi:hypothetical protein
MSRSALRGESVSDVDQEAATPRVLNADEGQADYLRFDPPAKLQDVFAELHKRNGLLSESDAAVLMDKSVDRFRHLFLELTGETYQGVRLRIKLS